MVKVAALSVAAMAAVVPLAVADNCQKGLYYCGYNLLNRGMCTYNSKPSARLCKKPVSQERCGSLIQDDTDVLFIGNYYNQIYQALVDNNQPTDSEHVNDSLFYCTGGSNGAIEFEYFCAAGVCTNGGNNNNDSCPK